MRAAGGVLFNATTFLALSALTCYAADVELALICKGNAAMTRHWGDFLHSYVLPLLKSLQAQGPGNLELSLVVYYTRSCYRYSGRSAKKKLVLSASIK